MWVDDRCGWVGDVPEITKKLNHIKLNCNKIGMYIYEPALYPDESPAFELVAGEPWLKKSHLPDLCKDIWELCLKIELKTFFKKEFIIADILSE